MFLYVTRWRSDRIDVLPLFLSSHTPDSLYHVSETGSIHGVRSIIVEILGQKLIILHQKYIFVCLPTHKVQISISVLVLIMNKAEKECSQLMMFSKLVFLFSVFAVLLFVFLVSP